MMDDEDVDDVYDDKPLTRIDTQLTQAVFVGHMHKHEKGNLPGLTD